MGMTVSDGLSTRIRSSLLGRCRMPIPALGTAVLQAIAPLLVSTLWRPSVLCQVEGPFVNEQLLDILREQLARCGPPNLTVPPCPACRCEPSLVTCALLVAGVVVLCGVCFALGIVAARCSPRLPLERDLPGQPAITSTSASPSSSAPSQPSASVLTPARLRALQG